jgi:hypothetical protein
VEIGVWSFDGIPTQIMSFCGVVSTFIKIGIGNQFRKIQIFVVSKNGGGDDHYHFPFKHS